MKNRSTYTKGLLARPRISIMAALVAACIGSEASALGFGRMSVQSALGQPLRAQVELTDARRVDGLKAGMASASTYAQKGVDYNPTVRNIRTSLRKLPNGRTVLILSSDTPINEPFIDIVLEATDGSGSVSRDFAILLDPPASKSTPAPVTQPTVSAGRSTVRETTGTAENGERIVIPSDVGFEEQDTPRKTVRRRRARSAMAGGSVRVRRGDTAGAIAMRNRPARVSLDQMLVALQRANSHAFINGNVNLLKSGVVLRMPSAQEVRSVSAAEARGIIVAQSEDFQAYRGRLAHSPMAQAPQSARQSTGRVQTQVEDGRQPAGVAPDTLTVAKADIGGRRNTEQRMAEAMQRQDNSNRAEELNRNLSDLKNISADVAASAQAGDVQSTNNAPMVVPPLPGATTSTPMPADTAASQPDGFASGVGEFAASAASSVEMSASAASAAMEDAASVAASQAAEPVSAPKPKRTPPRSAPETEEPGFFDSLTDNPLLLGGVGAAVLGGLGYMFIRRRKKNTENDLNSDFLDGDVASDSFFNTSGGKSVNTAENTTAGADDLNQSSMLYSPSQLDAEAEVNPVSEADVYLAYGRDLQAEEILKDALLKQPDHIQIRAKLLEIYARRRDVKAYAQTAAELKKLTSGKGPEWDVASAKGAEIDPGNPLYAGAGVAQQQRAQQPVVSANVAAASGAAGATATASTAINTEAAVPANQQAVIPEITTPATQQNIGADVSLNDVSLHAPELQAPPQSVPVQHAVETANNAGLDFDMSGLTFDTKEGAAASTSTSEQDAMETKLALAREFVNIGDKDSARAMAQEVIAHGNNDLKAQAESFLQSIS